MLTKNIKLMVPKIFYPSRAFVKSMDDRREEQEAKAFTDDIKYFLSKETFNMFDFHERVLVKTINNAIERLKVKKLNQANDLGRWCRS